MNEKIRPSCMKLIVLIFLQLVCVFCKEGTTGKNVKMKHTKTDTQNIFISHVIYTPEATVHKFISHLQNEQLPVWRKLRSESIIDELSVFRLAQLDSTTTDSLPCNYLILTHLRTGVNARDFLKKENFIMRSDSSLFKLLRTEVLNCVPNAYFPALHPENSDKIEFLVEFIAVKDSAQFLKKFHDLMDIYFGPANGLLVQEGKLYNLYMMETKEVVYQADNRMAWNQIHLSGDFPEFINVDWDSLYTDLFRREFSCELDSVWALLPPRLNTSINCKGELISQLSIK